MCICIMCLWQMCILKDFPNLTLSILPILTIKFASVFKEIKISSPDWRLQNLTEKSCCGVYREAEPQGDSKLSFLPLTLWKLFRTHFWQKACNFWFVIKSSAKALHFHFQVKYCPESLWTPHPWRCLTPDWMGLWASLLLWPSGRFPAHSRRAAGWSLRPLVTQSILWFYEIPVPLVLIWQDLNSCRPRGSRKVECFFLAHCMAGTMSKGYSDSITRVGEERPYASLFVPAHGTPSHTIITTEFPVKQEEVFFVKY